MLREPPTWEFLFKVLKIFIAITVRSDIGADLCVTYVLHLMCIFFDPNLAKIPKCS